MKKIISLSLLSVFILAQETVSYLKLEQVNKIVDSTFSEEGIKSQGTTEIEEDAFVDNVYILQKPGVGEEIPGNLIDTTVTSSGSEVHQGLTTVKRGAKLQDAKLESINTISNLNAISGESFLSQANIIVGDDSNVTKLINSASQNIVGDGTAEQFEVTEVNSLEDTDTKNTTIHQGLIVIQNGADVTNLNISQKNTIQRSNMRGQNEINATQITQGQIRLEDSVVRNMTQSVENQIDNLTVTDSSSVDQAYIKSTQSDINNLNSKLNNLNNQDRIKNEINNVTMDNSVIKQSTITLERSMLDMLDRYNRGNGLQYNNLIHSVTIENNSTIEQSALQVNNRSILTVVEYFTAENPNNGQDAINEIKNVSAVDNSQIYQDKLELISATFEESTLHRTNSIKDTTMGNDSTLHQFYTKLMEQTTLKEAKLSGKSFVNDVYINNSSVAQSATTIQ